MSAKIISGTEISKEIRLKLKTEIETEIVGKGLKAPCLAVVLVGEDPASQVYVGRKHKACEELGIKSLQYLLPADTSEADLLALIAELNANPEVNGILCQLPLPKQISESKVIDAIAVEKDVDAFHPVNVGKIMTGDFDFLPCTPAGCIELIKAAGVEISGKSAVVVGRSNIVGKPAAMLLLHNHATVTIAHSRTANLAEVCRGADILVAAVGRAKMITADMIKPGAVVIDVGINRGEDGKLYGDVDYAGAADVAGAITPVPGGVGPMTIAMLMQNTVKAYWLQNK